LRMMTVRLILMNAEFTTSSVSESALNISQRKSPALLPGFH